MMTKEQAYETIETALQEGGKLHAFLSGGGLRVVRIEKEKKLVGYGEHPYVDEALLHLAEDWKAGGRPYEKVYGKEYDHYLTGAADHSSALDAWVAKGSSFDAACSEGKFIVELKGYGRTEVPEYIRKRVLSTGCEEEWESRGYRYNSYCPKSLGGVGTSVISSPPGRSNSDPWMFPVKKVGRADALADAITKALEAPEHECQEKDR